MMKHVPLLPPIVGTFLRMLRPAGTLLLVMLTTMYFFATLGVQLFGGLINKDPDRREFDPGVQHEAAARCWPFLCIWHTS